jgi:hypothetical protein
MALASATSSPAAALSRAANGSGSPIISALLGAWASWLARAAGLSTRLMTRRSWSCWRRKAWVRRRRAWKVQKFEEFKSIEFFKISENLKLSFKIYLFSFNYFQFKRLKNEKN